MKYLSEMEVLTSFEASAHESGIEVINKNILSGSNQIFNQDLHDKFSVTKRQIIDDSHFHDDVFLKGMEQQDDILDLQTGLNFEPQKSKILFEIDKFTNKFNDKSC